jgi:hypothetical protein
MAADIPPISTLLPQGGFVKRKIFARRHLVSLFYAFAGYILGIIRII